MNLCSKLEKFGFFPYQKKWLADDSRFKIGLWARQTGKDFCAAAEAVVDSIINPKTTWIVLAAGERQALESIAKAKDWARAFGLALPRVPEFADGDRPGHGQQASEVIGVRVRQDDHVDVRTPARTQGRQHRVLTRVEPAAGAAAGVDQQQPPVGQIHECCIALSHVQGGDAQQAVRSARVA